MIEKTRGIILRQIKYSDSDIVVQVYTREFGRMALMIKGMRSRRSGKHNILFQPLFILDMVIYYKVSRSIQMLKEFSVSYSPGDIFSDPKKSCMAVFLGEVLTSVLKEESPNVELYDFIEDSVKYFDSSKTGYINFHIAFLIGLSSYLGFEPGARTDKNDIYFDMINGRFVPVPPLHSYYATPQISEILAGFFATSYEQMSSIRLSGAVRNEVLEILLNYYSVHLPGLKKINSLQVLKEVFK